ncbi:hypothetical protein [Halalkalibacter akibai]|uniref:Uncharacterized protein n=1 Tax=Halalkalibacter akibai (strain ATCC 43226 / DSM 21942 / CIP 109018 / JCM 9157 / 1139) TaxID=1236973 RepID=W4QY69_HALA3|nr:hypothetical protein [Halalkalibacter akibai]GAE37075.1 hypothetical protein JCM9157_4319 [Halalkalibacter akibai JCM 9157]
MAKKTVPLLYIHQKKEAEIEATSEEFVYKKFKVQVKENKQNEKSEGYLLDLEELVLEKTDDLENENEGKQEVEK